MDICYVLEVTPEALLIGHGYDTALEDPLIFDKLRDPQERRLIAYYRSISTHQQKLQWSYLNLLTQIPTTTEIPEEFN